MKICCSMNRKMNPKSIHRSRGGGTKAKIEEKNPVGKVFEIVPKAVRWGKTGGRLGDE